MFETPKGAHADVPVYVCKMFQTPLSAVYCVEELLGVNLQVESVHMHTCWNICFNIHYWKLKQQFKLMLIFWHQHHTVYWYWYWYIFNKNDPYHWLYCCMKVILCWFLDYIQANCQIQSLQQVINNSIRYSVDCFPDWDADLHKKPLKAKLICFPGIHLDLDLEVTCLYEFRSCCNELLCCLDELQKFDVTMK